MYFEIDFDFTVYLSFLIVFFANKYQRHLALELGLGVYSDMVWSYSHWKHSGMHKLVNNMVYEN